MKKEQLRELKLLGEQHEKLKLSILEMCDSLDVTNEVKDKEVIKTAIEKSKKKLTEIEETYKVILNTIPIKKDARF